MFNLGRSLGGLLLIEFLLISIMIWLFRMHVIAWGIVIFFLMIAIAKLAVSLGFEAFSGDFYQNVDKFFVHQTWVKIPKADGSFLHGAVYREVGTLTEPRPYIIVAHGMNANVERTEWFIIPLIRAGFHVLAYNQNGHGLLPHRSPGDKRIYTELMVTVHDAVNFVMKQAECLRDAENKPIIGFVGHSTGGLMALTQAYLNPHIKVTIAMSQIHDFMEIATRKVPISSPQYLFKLSLKLGGAKIDYTEEENHTISPKYCLRPDPQNARRVFMIHTADDPLPIEEGYKNRDLAQIPNRNCLFLQKGGHEFRAQETVVVGQIITWFLTYLK